MKHLEEGECNDIQFHVQCNSQYDSQASEQNSNHVYLILYGY